MRPDRELDASIQSPVEPHLFLPAPWLPIRRGNYADPTKLGPLSTDAESGSFQFDVAISHMTGEPSQVTRVLRYELSLTRSEVATEGVLTLRGAGYFPEKGFRVLPWPLVSMCVRTDHATRDARFCLYRLGDLSLPGSSSTSFKGVTSDVPVTLTPLDPGWPMASCFLAGRFLCFHATHDGTQVVEKWMCNDYIP